MKQPLNHFIAVIFCGTIISALTIPACSCFPQQTIDQIETEQVTDVRKDERYLALTWVQNSAEYQLLAQQTYRLALLPLAVGIKDPKWSADEVQAAEGGFEEKNPALILDVDETVLDNSAFNARNIEDDKAYTTEAWNAWCCEEKSEAIPGALEFARAADAMGAKIFFVTNRRDVVKQATINNLNALGFKANAENVLTKNPEAGRGDDKVSRRAMVAKNHRVVLLIGDSMSDLCSGMGVPNQNQRNRTATEKSKMLGSRWIMMPNPVYGSWERALPKNEHALKTRR